MARSKFPKIIGIKEDINPEVMREIQDHIDRELDGIQVNKQIAQVTELDSGETDVPTIVAKLNSLLNKMNASELTED